MTPTHTGIATALALVVVAIFFIVPDVPFFGTSSQKDGSSSGTIINSQEPSSATMSTENASSLQITDLVVGTGATAAAGDSVTVQYVGSLTDGKVFDASANHGSDGFTFTLGVGQVIKGWDQGVEGMKEGGKRKLVIPADLAYGDRGAGNVIPPGATLIFEVELLKVQKSGR